MNAALKTWPKSLAHRPPPRNYLRAGARYFKAYARQQRSLIRGDEAEAPVILDGHEPHPDNGTSIAFFGEF